MTHAAARGTGQRAGSRWNTRLTKATAAMTATMIEKVTPAATRPNAAEAMPSPITGIEIAT